MAKLIEVTSVDTGKTRRMSSREFFRTFGKAEGKEILAGYLPNIIAVELWNGDSSVSASDIAFQFQSR